MTDVDPQVGPPQDAAQEPRESQETAATGASPEGTGDTGPAGQDIGTDARRDIQPDAGTSTDQDVDQDVAEPPGRDELAAALGAVAALTDDLKRLQAEYVNYKRRVDRDRELVKQNATYSVLSAMMPVLDDLDRAREHGELEGGFKAVADSLERIVAAHGLVKFGRPGDEFDPRFHEALMHAHSPDVTTTTCQSIISAGYQLGDRVVRPARVTVVDPEPQDESTQQ